MKCGVKHSVRSAALQRSPKHLEYDKPCRQGKTTAGFYTKSGKMEHTRNQGVSMWASTKKCTSELREENVKSF